MTRSMLIVMNYLETNMISYFLLSSIKLYVFHTQVFCVSIFLDSMYCTRLHIMSMLTLNLKPTI